MQTRRLLFAFLVLAAVPASVLGAPITRLVVFGDSLSDQGNAFLLTGGAFPPSPYVQRASNGPVGVERLAARLGLTLAPAAAGGTNYAVVGATTGPVTVPGTNPVVVTDNVAVVQYGQTALAGTGILNQLGSYLTTGPVGDAPSTLFVVWGGANDLLIDPSVAAAANAIANLAATIGGLYAAGGRNFLVPNLPDLSLTPSGLGLPGPAQAALQALSIGFNLGLAGALDGLSLSPGIHIARVDTFGLLSRLSANPAGFGFENATDACLAGFLAGGSSPCADPSSYVFWDSVHPTATAHVVVGDAFAAAVVPEPATLTLIGAGLVATVVARRRRSGRS